MNHGASSKFNKSYPIRLYAVLLIFLLSSCSAQPPQASFPTPTMNRALDSQIPTVTRPASAPAPSPTVEVAPTTTPSEVVVSVEVEDTPPAETEVAEPTAATEPPDAPAIPYSPESYPAALSSDGRFLAFSSANRTLVENDTNDMRDAFVFDRETGTYERVSIAGQDIETNGPSFAQDISADGRYVLFQSTATNLFPEGTQASSGLFIYDRESKQITFLDVGRSEVSFGFTARRGEISPDGQLVVFEAHHMDEPLPDGRIDTRNVFLYDRENQSVRRISQAADGVPASGESYAASMAPDGQAVIFYSTASNLVTGDSACSETNTSCEDLFAFFLEDNRMQRVATGFPGGVGGPSDTARISNRGSVIVFNAPLSTDPPLIHLVSLNPRSMEVICVTKENAPCAGFAPTLTEDGRRVAFVAPPAGPDGRWVEGSFSQVYLYDRQSRVLTPVSVDANGQPGNANSGMLVNTEGYSGSLAISGNGRWIAYASQAASLLPDGSPQTTCFNLMTGQEGLCMQILLYDTQTGETVLVAGGNE